MLQTLGQGFRSAVQQAARPLAPQASPGTRPRRVRYALETGEAYLYILPATVILIMFHFFPAFYAAYLSLFDTNMIKSTFVGLDNYVELFHDKDFWKAMTNTVYYVLGTVPASIAISLAVASLLNQKIRGLAFYRTIYFLPWVTPVVAISIVWTWIYHPDSSGLLNGILGAFGIKPIRWLLDPKWAMFAVVLMSIWRTIGYNVVIFLAGLQNISNEYYEAAMIDGASRWQMFRNVTWPLLSPTTYFVTIISIIGSFQVFSQVYVMTPTGGPLGATRVAVYYLYEKAWGSYEMGYASAIGCILFVLIFALTLIQRKYLGSRVHYQ